jgi:hypothetical protein
MHNHLLFSSWYKNAYHFSVHNFQLLINLLFTVIKSLEIIPTWKIIFFGLINMHITRNLQKVHKFYVIMFLVLNLVIANYKT